MPRRTRSWALEGTSAGEHTALDNVSCHGVGWRPVAIFRVAHPASSSSSSVICSTARASSPTANAHRVGAANRADVDPQLEQRRRVTGDPERTPGGPEGGVEREEHLRDRAGGDPRERVSHPLRERRVELDRPVLEDADRHGHDHRISDELPVACPYAPSVAATGDRSDGRVVGDREIAGELGDQIVEPTELRYGRERCVATCSLARSAGQTVSGLVPAVGVTCRQRRRRAFGDTSTCRRAGPSA